MTTSGPDATTDAMLTGFFRAWERRDINHVLSCCTDDAVWEFIPMEPIVGKPAITQWASRYIGRSPDSHFEIHHQLVTGPFAMNERTDHISFKGKAVSLRVCGAFEIEDSRIKAWRDYFDTGAFAGLAGQ